MQTLDLTVDRQAHDQVTAPYYKIQTAGSSECFVMIHSKNPIL